MPYDLFATDQDTYAPAASWEFLGTYPKLWLAEVERDRFGQQRPELRCWCLYYVRRSTARAGALHSMGDYPLQKVKTHG